MTRRVRRTLASLRGVWLECEGERMSMRSRVCSAGKNHVRGLIAPVRIEGGV
jgi:hypothetical protein